MRPLRDVPTTIGAIPIHSPIVHQLVAAAAVGRTIPASVFLLALRLASD